MSDKPDQELDCKELSCPVPMMKLAQTMKKMKKGQVLRMEGTDPGTKRDVPCWCKKTGHEFLGVTEKDGVYTYLIKCNK